MSMFHTYVVLMASGRRDVNSVLTMVRLKSFSVFLLLALVPKKYCYKQGG